MSSNLKKYIRKTYKPKIIHDILIACNQLQGQHKNLIGTEDSRNSFITTVLTNRGVIAKDQARWGKSATGKGQGELDIKIELQSGIIESIFEGYNISYLNSTVITNHYKKIFDYDPNGLKSLFLVGYVESKRFNQIWSEYQELIEKVEIEFIIVDDFIDISSEFEYGSNLKVGMTKHKRNNRITELYHVFVLLES